jgi:hypothetical protein
MSSDLDALERIARAAIENAAVLKRDLVRAGLWSEPEPFQTSLPVSQLISALDAFPGLVGYLNGRRAGGGVTSVDSEADVQDLLFLSLKPIFPEMVYEQPTDKGAASYSVGDFHLPSLKLILEAKYVSRREDVKRKADEIAEDIWKYATQTDCERIIFFVYDPKLLIPDRPNYARSLTTRDADFRAAGRDLEIRTVIKP